MLRVARWNNWTAYRIEFVLALAGTCFLGKAGVDWHSYRSFQAAHTLQYLPSTAISQIASIGKPVGRLTVPRLHLSTVIVEGDGEDELRLGAGHDPASAALGSNGNIVVAGHRDTAFWPLRHLQVGDRVQIDAAHRSIYKVQSLTVVDPTDTALLRPVPDSVLTLVTCYPFRYVGPAPKRLIIRAVPQ